MIQIPKFTVSPQMLYLFKEWPVTEMCNAWKRYDSVRINWATWLDPMLTNCKGFWQMVTNCYQQKEKNSHAGATTFEEYEMRNLTRSRKAVQRTVQT